MSVQIFVYVLLSLAVVLIADWYGHKTAAHVMRICYRIHGEDRKMLVTTKIQLFAIGCFVLGWALGCYYGSIVQ